MSGGLRSCTRSSDHSRSAAAAPSAALVVVAERRAREVHQHESLLMAQGAPRGLAELRRRIRDLAVGDALRRGRSGAGPASTHSRDPRHSLRRRPADRTRTAWRRLAWFLMEFIYDGLPSEPSGDAAVVQEAQRGWFDRSRTRPRLKPVPHAFHGRSRHRRVGLGAGLENSGSGWPGIADRSNLHEWHRTAGARRNGRR
jgi:hypothetical protein